MCLNQEVGGAHVSGCFEQVEAAAWCLMVGIVYLVYVGVLTAVLPGHNAGHSPITQEDMAMYR